MCKLEEILDHPIAKYLAIMSMSLLAAAICAWLGGLAHDQVARGAEDQLTGGMGGFKFKAVGATAGFGTIALISWAMISDFTKKRLPKSQARRNLKVILVPRDRFEANLRYHFEVDLFDDETGGKRTISGEPRRVNGHLEIGVPDMGDQETYRIRLSAPGKKSWESEFHTPMSPKAEMVVV